LAGTYTTTSTYNVDGSQASVTYPAAGGLDAETVTTGYDTTGRPLTLTGTDAYVADTRYHSFGPVYQQVLGTAGKRVRVTAGVDEATDRLTQVTTDTETPGAPATFTEALTELYRYDPAGNVTGIRETAAGATVSNQCFGYDGLRELTEAWTTTADACQATPNQDAVGGPDAYWSSYRYTTTGGRAQETRHNASGDTTRTYTYPAAKATQPHALGAVTTASTGVMAPTADAYVYDPAGNLITRSLAGKAAQTLTWDPEGHLATVTDDTGTTSYLYDADGNRLLSRDPTGTTAYLGTQELHLTGSTVTATRFYAMTGRSGGHDGGTSAIEGATDPAKDEENGGSASAQDGDGGGPNEIDGNSHRYVAGNGAAGDPYLASAVRTTAGGLAWQVGDHHGTTQLSINVGTQVVTHRRFDPFGNPRGTSLNWPTTRGFVNGTADATGMTHLGVRDYDPAVGRFISVDSILNAADPLQMNGYSYADNTPVTFSDTTGTRPECGGGTGNYSCSNEVPVAPGAEGKVWPGNNGRVWSQGQGTTNGVPTYESNKKPAPSTPNNNKPKSPSPKPKKQTWNPTTWTAKTWTRVGMGIAAVGLAATGVGLLAGGTLAVVATGVSLGAGLAGTAIDGVQCARLGDRMACGGAILGGLTLGFGGAAIKAGRMGYFASSGARDLVVKTINVGAVPYGAVGSGIDSYNFARNDPWFGK
jgi:RHS repeat-associated protein